MFLEKKRTRKIEPCDVNVPLVENGEKTKIIFFAENLD